MKAKKSKIIIFAVLIALLFGVLVACDENLGLRSKNPIITNRPDCKVTFYILEENAMFFYGEAAYSAGDIISIPRGIKEKYDENGWYYFDDWYFDEAFTQEADGIEIKRDISVYGRYLPYTEQMYKDAQGKRFITEDGFIVRLDGDAWTVVGYGEGRFDDEPLLISENGRLEWEGDAWTVAGYGEGWYNVAPPSEVPIYLVPNITIPHSFMGKPVTKIGNGAFRNNSFIESVIVSDSIISIGDFAFANCENLTVVSIPPSVKQMGWNVFKRSDGYPRLTVFIFGRSKRPSGWSMLWDAGTEESRFNVVWNAKKIEGPNDTDYEDGED